MGKTVKTERDEVKGKLSGLPRSGPTVERIVGSGSLVSVSRFGTVRLTESLPTTLVRMRAKGSLSDADLKAAAWLIAVHDRGFGSTMRSVKYEERTSGGGGAGADRAMAARVQAQENWEWAMGMLIPEVRQAVVAVVINGATLTGIDGFIGAYSKAEARRMVGGAFLRLGLSHLAVQLGLTSPPKAMHISAIPRKPLTEAPES
ncbi:hypothetical protein DES40_1734 [Litorimonas taeanensis]|uniref:Uncharacterized protein n=1 Tax=Litorimonas taeanensis TaxID=568099 RepID=A0A420WDA0_9PROT|nr:hypothetical protein [Litorimonas taeanensis]RKQ68958.1 hypothetical protein DES40_1734 [Litorimonas taeanensis]